MLTRLTRKNLDGVWAALIVPWTEDDRLDEQRFASECRAYGDTGVAGIYTGGTTGEFYAQDDDTFKRLTHIACDQAHAIGLPVQIGCTALSTRTARLRIRVALDAGADAIQIAYPFWLELKPDEVLAFFRGIAQEAAGTPLVLYHTSRCKRKMTPDEVGRLAQEVPTFIGMKDTGCDLDTLRALLAVVPDLAIFGGEDFFERVPAGGRGGYCSISGLNPRFIVRYYALCRHGQLDEARPYATAVRRLLDEVLLPMVTEEGLWDSAVDRVMRVAGGHDVGLNCQGPYRRATPAHVDRVRNWCRANAPQMLAGEV